MAYPVNTNDVVQVNWWQEINYQKIMNTFFYQYIGAPAQADGQTFLSALLTSLTTDAAGFYLLAKAQQMNTLSWQYVTAQKVHPYRYAPVTVTLNQLGGVTTGTPLPQNVAAVIRRNVEVADSRGLQGRVHLAGLPMTVVNSGNLTTAAITSLNSVRDAIIKSYSSSAGAATWRPVTFNNKKNPATSYPIISGLVNTTIRVIRRRTVGLGM